MTRRNILIGSLIAFCMLLSAPTFISAARAQTSARAKGAIRSVDLRSSTVTIAKRNNETLTLQTNERTEIKLNGEPARLSDLQPGDKVKAVYDTTSFHAKKIDATGPARQPVARVEGTFTAIDRDASAVVISPMSLDEPVRLSVTPDTTILLDGQAASLADLASGFKAEAFRRPDSVEAVQITAERLAEIRGVVRDVSVANSTVTIDPLTGESTVTLNVTADTTLSLDGQPARLDDLARGYHIRASYDPQTFNAVRIAATSLLEILGRITAVNVPNATVTIAPLTGGPPVEMQVVHSTVITINGEAQQLERLQPWMGARAVYNLASLVAVHIAAHTTGGECTVESATGEIARVHVENNTLVIATPEGRLVTLNVTPNTEITLNGRPARLHELAAGMRAGARFCRENFNALGVAAFDPTPQCTVVGVEGVIARVHLETSQVVIATANGEFVTLEVTNRTEITINGRPARLHELEPGMRAGARFCRETSVALAIGARTDSGQCTPVSVTGLIARVHLETRQVVIALANGEFVTLNVTDRTEITVNNQPARLDDLQPGMQATARFCRETLEALAIVATDRRCTVTSVEGVIARVHLETRQLVIALANGELVTLNVTDRTEITLNGRPARLNDLEPGMRVGARFCRETFEALAIAAVSPTPGCTVVGVEGLIARVHVETRQLVIAISNTELVTLNVTPETEIRLNGQPARLADLQPGMRVAARFCRETLNALFISATSPTPGCTVEDVAGTIARVDLENRQIVIQPATTANPLTLNVTDRTEITLDGNPARLSDLRPGMRVGARFCRETLNALQISARTPPAP